MSTIDKGISRRNLLKKSAAAGAVFWAVPAIESITSRAAAQSGCATFSSSWVYVVWTSGTTINYTGYSKADEGHSTCTPAANPHGSKSTSTCASNTVYTLLSGGAPPGVAYKVGTNPTRFATYVACPTGELTLTGGQVSATGAGVTILAAFCFGADTIMAICVGGGSVCPACD